MKRIILLFLALTLTVSLSAQKHDSKKSPSRVPTTPSITVQAQGNENFYVYLNGNLINEAPRSQVVVDRLDNNLQEVIVVLNQPARKAVVMEVYATPNGTPITVNYSRRNNQLTLTAPEASLPHNNAPHHHDNPRPPAEGTHPAVAPPQVVVNPVVVNPEPTTVSDEWVNEMVGILKNQSFDNERASTATGLLNNPLPFTTNQIIRIVSTFDFPKSQVDFLKAAYTHCIDPENYERALAVLTFPNDRQTVRTYIQSLR